MWTFHDLFREIAAIQVRLEYDRADDALEIAKRVMEDMPDYLEQANLEFEQELANENMDRWIDRHSVNCYFCGKLFDERESCGTTDGGDVCPECYKDQNNRELVEVE